MPHEALPFPLASWDLKADPDSDVEVIREVKSSRRNFCRKGKRLGRMALAISWMRATVNETA